MDYTKYQGLRKYSEDQMTKALELRKEGVSTQQISEVTGVSVGMLGSLFHFNRITLDKSQKKNNHYKHVPQQNVDQVIELRKQRKTVKEIQELTKLTVGSIKYILKANNITLRNSSTS